MATATTTKHKATVTWYSEDERIECEAEFTFRVVPPDERDPDQTPDIDVCEVYATTLRVFGPIGDGPLTVIRSCEAAQGQLHAWSNALRKLYETDDGFSRTFENAAWDSLRPDED